MKKVSDAGKVEQLDGNCSFSYSIENFTSAMDEHARSYKMPYCFCLIICSSGFALASRYTFTGAELVSWGRF